MRDALKSRTDEDALGCEIMMRRPSDILARQPNMHPQIAVASILGHDDGDQARNPSTNK